MLEVGNATNRSDEPRTLRYDFSPEVKDVHVKPEDAAKTINFHLVKRDAPAGE